MPTSQQFSGDRENFDHFAMVGEGETQEISCLVDIALDLERESLFTL